MSQPVRNERAEPRWKQIPNLPPPVKEFPFRERRGDEGGPFEVDEFNRMIREMRDQDREPSSGRE